MLRMAVPAMLLISELRNEVRAVFIENELVVPLARYIPEASIVMAILPRSSTLIEFNSSWMVWSLDAEMINWIPGFSSV